MRTWLIFWCFVHRAINTRTGGAENKTKNNEHGSTSHVVAVVVFGFECCNVDCYYLLYLLCFASCTQMASYSCCRRRGKTYLLAARRTTCRHETDLRVRLLITCFVKCRS